MGKNSAPDNKPKGTNLADPDAGQPDQNPAQTNKRPSKKTIFYWIKVPSYANDTELCMPGVYRMTESVDRFDRSPSRYVEKFEDEIPEAVLFDIAKMLNVTVENTVKGKRVFRDYEDILEEIVTDK